ncbi:oleate hydratase, partial [Streptococcus agalactiae]|nr:oleate hydratase [Streptococcus agalactiae]
MGSVPFPPSLAVPAASSLAAFSWLAPAAPPSSPCRLLPPRGLASPLLVLFPSAPFPAFVPLVLAPAASFGAPPLAAVFSPAFFARPFWPSWAPLFAFAPWPSALALRRSALRFLPPLGGLPAFPSFPFPPLSSASLVPPSSVLSRLLLSLFPLLARSLLSPSPFRPVRRLPPPFLSPLVVPPPLALPPPAFVFVPPGSLPARPPSGRPAPVAPLLPLWAVLGLFGPPSLLPLLPLALLPSSPPLFPRVLVCFCSCPPPRSRSCPFSRAFPPRASLLVPSLPAALFPFPLLLGCCVLLSLAPRLSPRPRPCPLVWLSGLSSPVAGPSLPPLAACPGRALPRRVVLSLRCSCPAASCFLCSPSVRPVPVSLPSLPRSFLPRVPGARPAVLPPALFPSPSLVLLPPLPPALPSFPRPLLFALLWPLFLLSSLLPVVFPPSFLPPLLFVSCCPLSPLSLLRPLLPLWLSPPCLPASRRPAPLRGPSFAAFLRAAPLFSCPLPSRPLVFLAFFVFPRLPSPRPCPFVLLSSLPVRPAASFARLLSRPSFPPPAALLSLFGRPARPFPFLAALSLFSFLLALPVFRSSVPLPPPSPRSVPLAAFFVLVPRGLPVPPSAVVPAFSLAPLVPLLPSLPFLRPPFFRLALVRLSVFRLSGPPSPLLAFPLLLLFLVLGLLARAPLFSPSLSPSRPSRVVPFPPPLPAPRGCRWCPPWFLAWRSPRARCSFFAPRFCCPLSPFRSRAPRRFLARALLALAPLASLRGRPFAAAFVLFAAAPPPLCPCPCSSPVLASLLPACPWRCSPLAFPPPVPSGLLAAVAPFRPLPRLPFFLSPPRLLSAPCRCCPPPCFFRFRPSSPAPSAPACCLPLGAVVRACVPLSPPPPAFRRFSAGVLPFPSPVLPLFFPPAVALPSSLVSCFFPRVFVGVVLPSFPALFFALFRPPCRLLLRLGPPSFFARLCPFFRAPSSPRRPLRPPSFSGASSPVLAFSGLFSFVSRPRAACPFLRSAFACSFVFVPAWAPPLRLSLCVLVLAFPAPRVFGPCCGSAPPVVSPLRALWCSRLFSVCSPFSLFRSRLSLSVPSFPVPFSSRSPSCLFRSLSCPCLFGSVSASCSPALLPLPSPSSSAAWSPLSPARAPPRALAPPFGRFAPSCPRFVPWSLPALLPLSLLLCLPSPGLSLFRPSFLVRSSPRSRFSSSRRVSACFAPALFSAPSVPLRFPRCSPAPASLSSLRSPVGPAPLFFPSSGGLLPAGPGRVFLPSALLRLLGAFLVAVWRSVRPPSLPCPAPFSPPLACAWPPPPVPCFSSLSRLFSPGAPAPRRFSFCRPLSPPFLSPVFLLRPLALGLFFSPAAVPLFRSSCPPPSFSLPLFPPFPLGRSPAGPSSVCLSRPSPFSCSVVRPSCRPLFRPPAFSFVSFLLLPPPPSLAPFVPVFFARLRRPAPPFWPLGWWGSAFLPVLACSPSRPPVFRPPLSPSPRLPARRCLPLPSPGVAAPFFLPFSLRAPAALAPPPLLPAPPPFAFVAPLASALAPFAPSAASFSAPFARLRVLARALPPFFAPPPRPLLSLGCGLAPRFARVAPGPLRWSPLALPAVLALRPFFFAAPARVPPLAPSALAAPWPRAVPPPCPFLLVSAGVFLFLPAAAVAPFLPLLPPSFRPFWPPLLCVLRPCFLPARPCSRPVSGSRLSVWSPAGPALVAFAPPSPLPLLPFPAALRPLRSAPFALSFPPSSLSSCFGVSASPPLRPRPPLSFSPAPFSLSLCPPRSRLCRFVSFGLRFPSVRRSPVCLLPSLLLLVRLFLPWLLRVSSCFFAFSPFFPPLLVSCCARLACRPAAPALFFCALVFAPRAPFGPSLCRFFRLLPSPFSFLPFWVVLPLSAVRCPACCPGPVSAALPAPSCFVRVCRPPRSRASRPGCPVCPSCRRPALPFASSRSRSSACCSPFRLSACGCSFFCCRRSGCPPALAALLAAFASSLGALFLSLAPLPPPPPRPVPLLPVPWVFSLSLVFCLFPVLLLLPRRRPALFRFPAALFPASGLPALLPPWPLVPSPPPGLCCSRLFPAFPAARPLRPPLVSAFSSSLLVFLFPSLVAWFFLFLRLFLVLLLPFSLPLLPCRCFGPSFPFLAAGSPAPALAAGAVFVVSFFAVWWACFFSPPALAFLFCCAVFRSLAWRPAALPFPSGFVALFGRPPVGPSPSSPCSGPPCSPACSRSPPSSLLGLSPPPLRPLFSLLPRPSSPPARPWCFSGCSASRPFRAVARSFPGSCAARAAPALLCFLPVFRLPRFLFFSSSPLAPVPPPPFWPRLLPSVVPWLFPPSCPFLPFPASCAPLLPFLPAPLAAGFPSFPAAPLPAPPAAFSSRPGSCAGPSFPAPRGSSLRRGSCRLPARAAPPCFPCLFVPLSWFPCSSPGLLLGPPGALLPPLGPWRAVLLPFCSVLPFPSRLGSRPAPGVLPRLLSLLLALCPRVFLRFFCAPPVWGRVSLVPVRLASPRPALPAAPPLVPLLRFSSPFLPGRPPACWPLLPSRRAPAPLLFAPLPSRRCGSASSLRFSALFFFLPCFSFVSVVFRFLLPAPLLLLCLAFSLCSLGFCLPPRPARRPPLVSRCSALWVLSSVSSSSSSLRCFFFSCPAVCPVSPLSSFPFLSPCRCFFSARPAFLLRSSPFSCPSLFPPLRPCPAFSFPFVFPARLCPSVCLPCLSSFFRPSARCSVLPLLP